LWSNVLGMNNVATSACNATVPHRPMRRL
jgi:hypothetical protein